MTDYLQNQEGGDELVFRMVAPILNDLLSKSLISASPSYLSNSVFASNVGSNLKYPISRRVSAPNSVVPTIASRLVASVGPNIISNNVMSSTTSDDNIENVLVSKLLNLLGGGV